jgi:hypothetical protein
MKYPLSGVRHNKPGLEVECQALRAFWAWQALRFPDRCFNRRSNYTVFWNFRICDSCLDYF